MPLDERGGFARLGRADQRTVKRLLGDEGDFGGLAVFRHAAAVRAGGAERASRRQTVVQPVADPFQNARQLHEVRFSTRQTALRSMPPRY
jgi:hypothetical protein